MFLFVCHAALAWVTTALSMVGRLAICMAFAVIYIYSAELFPTVVRQSAVSASSLCATIGGITAPYIAEMVISHQSIQHRRYQMCMYVCVYVCICVYVCMYVCMCVDMYVCVCMSVCTCMYVCVWVGGEWVEKKPTTTIYSYISVRTVSGFFMSTTPWRNVIVLHKQERIYMVDCFRSTLILC